ncbi:MAG TPA: hypothetical protein VKB78_17100, partial [Pirellulales bacterium]|nr:hypothetical protein [Pirellulales bacterium]
IEALRRDVAPAAGFSRIVVAIDPSGSDDPESDECGIIVAGLDATQNQHGWVICDASGKYSPNEWAKIAIGLYHKYAADRIVAEINYGGQMVESTIRAVDPNVSYTSVTASRGKVARAEPISALYEQNRVHHLGVFPQLEDEMADFTSDFDRKVAGYSPNRVDALVWGLSELMCLPMRGGNFYELYRRLAEGTITIGPPPPPKPDKPYEVRKAEALMRERERFAEIVAEKMPTAEEIETHNTRIEAIIRDREFLL